MMARLIPVEYTTYVLTAPCSGAAGGCKCKYYQVAMFLSCIRVVMGRN